ncbi:hypothetical protein OG394_28885 [Kribbella sp. NBC_01245]|uniref:hypothetical protein n=1 Tax=Kribbella sp. NBC_01245 TaxID=2903578 RepID=UPI002E2B2ED8|nr:hypothetical protein [Kribbella sp. NBC_01245]
MKLKVRVVHYRRQGLERWYADIDDADDRQPDDPTGTPTDTPASATPSPPPVPGYSN